jgi:hypothetical protein
VDQGNDVEQVILAQLLESVGQLLHVDVLVAPILLLGCIFVTDAVCVGGARLCQECEQLWLGVAECLDGGCQQTFPVTTCLFTHNLMPRLVALGLEVEVVIKSMLAALADRREHDAHVELSPALLFDVERGLLEHWLVSV